MSAKIPQITQYSYSRQLLDAIASEKCGFKGMRLLTVGFGNPARRAAFTLWFEKRRFPAYKRIDPPGYPAGLPQGVYDYLWMASAKKEKWEEMRGIMTARLRWAAVSDEEFLQAAATQIVFTHCGMLIGSARASAGLVVDHAPPIA